MAGGDQPLTRAATPPGGLAAGGAALAVIAAIAGLPIVVLLLAAADIGASAGGLVDAYLLRVVRFTLWQAAASTLVSVVAAVPVALALARRRRFPGRAGLLRLMALPLALPALVAVLGIVEVWGRQGWVSDLMRATGLGGGLDIYGLSGILLAHAFFNLPLAARLLLARLEEVPPEHWRLAAQLGFRPRDVFARIDRPVLAAALPGIAGLIFMLCLTSFTVVLMLGGGPAATTTEVAIYQALRFDFDPARAVLLALVQVALCAAAYVTAGRIAADLPVGAATGRLPVARPDAVAPVLRLADIAVIGCAAAFVAAPMAATVAAGLEAPLARLAGDAMLWRAAATSLAIAASAAALALSLAGGLIAARRAVARVRAPGAALRAVDTAAGVAATVTLVLPPVVLGAGWFLILRHTGDVSAWAPAVVLAVNALMALPFVMRVVGPAAAAAAQRHDRLCRALGIVGWTRLRLVDLPVLARPLGLAVLFAAALSLGDLGAAALFGNPDFVTLPLLLMQRMGAYRTTDAAGLALLLAVLCLALMAAGERLTAHRGGR